MGRKLKLKLKGSRPFTRLNDVTSLEAAQAYIRRWDWKPIPAPSDRKGPVEKGWQDWRLTLADLPAHFTNGENIGILLGEPSGGLSEVDLDCPEALAVAPLMLPPTLMSGRKHSPRSHYWYIVEPLPKYSKLMGLGGKDDTIVELRTGPGHQTLVAPSRHPDDGDRYRWENDARPAPINGDALAQLVKELATAALMVRYWTKTSRARNSFTMALAGFLGRRLSRERVLELIEVITTAAEDEEAKERRKTAMQTLDKLDRGEPVTGAPELDNIVPGLGQRLADWWGKGPSTEASLSSLTSLLSHQESVKWPKDLTDQAFQGLAGEVVHALEPHTEADPAALLLNFMVAFGNLLGDGPHLRIGSDRHPVRLNAVLVGATSKARKGTSWSPIRELLAPLDLGWSQNQIVEGLSSGEGLIYAVRDPQFKEEPVKEKKRVVEYERVRTDPGATDKRLLVIESEFGRTLKTMGREGNTLSAVMRQAWDTGDLNVLTKNNPIKATGAHISIVGHITNEELQRNLDSTDAANGFANRFIWMAVKRSKCLPEGGRPPDTQLKVLRAKLERVMRFAERVGKMRFSKGGLILWHIKYPRLSEGKPGLVGLMTGRAEAQVLRMACLYALLDRSAEVKTQHIKAALTIWRRAEASVRYIFGDRLGDPVADTILAEVRERGSLTQMGISNLFQRHQSADRIARSLLSLQKAGLIRVRQERTGGRPQTIWEYAGAKEAK